jgi:hypothetical protein
MILNWKINPLYLSYIAHSCTLSTLTSTDCFFPSIPFPSVLPLSIFTPTSPILFYPPSLTLPISISSPPFTNLRSPIVFNTVEFFSDQKPEFWRSDLVTTEVTELEDAYKWVLERAFEKVAKRQIELIYGDLMIYLGEVTQYALPVLKNYYTADDYVEFEWEHGYLEQENTELFECIFIFDVGIGDEIVTLPSTQNGNTLCYFRDFNKLLYKYVGIRSKINGEIYQYAYIYKQIQQEISINNYQEQQKEFDGMFYPWNWVYYDAIGNKVDFDKGFEEKSIVKSHCESWKKVSPNKFDVDIFIDSDSTEKTIISGRPFDIQLDTREFLYPIEEEQKLEITSDDNFYLIKSLNYSKIEIIMNNADITSNCSFISSPNDLSPMYFTKLPSYASFSSIICTLVPTSPAFSPLSSPSTTIQIAALDDKIHIPIYSSTVTFIQTPPTSTSTSTPIESSSTSSSLIKISNGLYRNRSINSTSPFSSSITLTATTLESLLNKDQYEYLSQLEDSFCLYVMNSGQQETQVILKDSLRRIVQWQMPTMPEFVIGGKLQMVRILGSDQGKLVLIAEHLDTIGEQTLVTRFSDSVNRLVAKGLKEGVYGIEIVTGWEIVQRTRCRFVSNFAMDVVTLPVINENTVDWPFDFEVNVAALTDEVNYFELLLEYETIYGNTVQVEVTSNSMKNGISYPFVEEAIAQNAIIVVEKELSLVITQSERLKLPSDGTLIQSLTFSLSNSTTSTLISQKAYEEFLYPSKTTLYTFNKSFQPTLPTAVISSIVISQFIPPNSTTFTPCLGHLCSEPSFNLPFSPSHISPTAISAYSPTVKLHADLSSFLEVSSVEFPLAIQMTIGGTKYPVMEIVRGDDGDEMTVKVDEELKMRHGEAVEVELEVAVVNWDLKRHTRCYKRYLGNQNLSRYDRDYFYRFFYLLDESIDYVDLQWVYQNMELYGLHFEIVKEQVYLQSQQKLYVFAPLYIASFSPKTIYIYSQKEESNAIQITLTQELDINHNYDLKCHVKLQNGTQFYSSPSSILNYSILCPIVVTQQNEYIILSLYLSDGENIQTQLSKEISVVIKAVEILQYSPILSLPQGGGTMVIRTNTDLTKFDFLGWEFGSSITLPATIISPTTISCKIPPWRKTGTINVNIEDFVLGIGESWSLLKKETFTYCNRNFSFFNKHFLTLHFRSI